MTLQIHMYFTPILINLWQWTWMHIWYNDVNVNDGEWQSHCFKVQSNYSYSFRMQPNSKDPLFSTALFKT